MTTALSARVLHGSRNSRTAAAEPAGPVPWTVRPAGSPTRQAGGDAASPRVPGAGNEAAAATDEQGGTVAKGRPALLSALCADTPSDAGRGFIARLVPCATRPGAPSGTPTSPASSTATGRRPRYPSLRRQSRLTARQGLYEVVLNVRLVRGPVLSDIGPLRLRHPDGLPRSALRDRHSVTWPCSAVVGSGTDLGDRSRRVTPGRWSGGLEPEMHQVSGTS